MLREGRKLPPDVVDRIPGLISRISKDKEIVALFSFGSLAREDFAKDPLLQGSAERFLQLAIECCLNIGNRLIALHQFENPIDTPETYADIFIQLRNMEIIDGPLCDRLVKMAKFRNRLVHLYWEI
jgi:uncharacterized protein YutE (UPF0331/DUF86 family)